MSYMKVLAIKEMNTLCKGGFMFGTLDDTEERKMLVELRQHYVKVCDNLFATKICAAPAVHGCCVECTVGLLIAHMSNRIINLDRRAYRVRVAAQNKALATAGSKQRVG